MNTTNIVDKIKQFCIQQSTLLLLIALIISAAYVRFHRLSEQNVNYDEPMWQIRSMSVVKNLMHKEWLNVDTKTKHPGLIPAITAGFSMKLYREYLRYTFFKDINTFIAGRVPFVCIGVLMPVCMFLWGRKIMPPFIAYTAALFIALDPRSIGYSRIMHLDSMLTFFMLLSLLSFCIGEQKSSLAWKISSSVFLGCVGLTKMSGLVIIVCVFCIRIVFMIMTRQYSFGCFLKKLGTDVAWAFGGLFFYMTFYPALWRGLSPHVWTKTTAMMHTLFFYETLAALPLLSSMIMAVFLYIALTFLVLPRYTGRQQEILCFFKKIVYACIICIAILYVITLYKNPICYHLNLFMTPYTYKNVSGYEARQYCLGIMTKTPPWFYYFLFTPFCFTEVMLLFLIIGSVIVIVRLVRKPSFIDALLIGFPITVLCFMSIPGARLLRYMHGMFPWCAFLAGIGLHDFFVWFKGQCARGFLSYIPGGFTRVACPYIVVVLFFLYNYATAWSMRPDYHHYANALIGGPAGLNEYIHVIETIGLRQAMKYLKKIAKPYDRIEVLGANVQQCEYYWKSLRPRIKHVAFLRKSFPRIDYFVVLKNAERSIEMKNKPAVLLIKTKAPIYTVRRYGMDLAKIYRVS